MSLTYFAEGTGFLIMIAVFAVAIAAVSYFVYRSKRKPMASLIAVCMGFVALGLSVLVMSANLTHSVFSANEAAMIPNLWASLLIPTALLIIYRALVGIEADPEKSGRLDKVLAVAVVLIVTTFLIKYIGYFISSAIFVFACMYILEYRKYVTMTILSLAWVAFSYLIFYRLLWVTLPIGSVIKSVFNL